MANETISKTERENREEMDKRIMEQIFEEQRALGQISEDASLAVEDQSQSTSEPSGILTNITEFNFKMTLMREY